MGGRLLALEAGDFVYCGGLMGERGIEVSSKVFFPAFQDLYFVCVGVSLFVFNSANWFPLFSLAFLNCSKEVVAVDVFMV